jgi:hypothetical protein
MIAQKTVNGYSAIYLENERLRVGVLPEKGADIFEISCTFPGRSGPIQLLMRTPWGLKPPPQQPPIDFLDNYEGGWQELFPNANDACEYRGRQIPFHGEVALEPWKFELPAPVANELHLWVECRRTPFRLERTMSVDAAEGVLTLREKVTNLSSEPADLVWGHHITLGGDFLEDGCILNIPAHELYTADTLYEPLTARLEPAQAGRWPFARTRRGGLADLSRIPGPTARTHDDVILGGLERGFYEVVQPRLECAFSLEWDAGVFPWLMYWQPYGGADLPPLTGIYGVGLEPWVSRYPLARAVEEGQARRLAGGESLETALVAAVRQI